MNCQPGYAEGVGTQAQLGSPFDVVFHYPSNSLFFFEGPTTWTAGFSSGGRTAGNTSRSQAHWS